ncbi:hypothetical protein [Parashewanella tropica]|uniref:hypothetical protein n=1 Tax=Parashewanella tropica TaxID=2547970 RepID=UPI00105A4137|nr:hypothetical protein [Parashewanella tropica]
MKFLILASALLATPAMAAKYYDWNTSEQGSWIYASTTDKLKSGNDLWLGCNQLRNECAVWLKVHSESCNDAATYNLTVTDGFPKTSKIKSQCKNGEFHWDTDNKKDFKVVQKIFTSVEQTFREPKQDMYVWLKKPTGKMDFGIKGGTHIIMLMLPSGLQRSNFNSSAFPFNK